MGLASYELPANPHVNPEGFKLPRPPLLVPLLPPPKTTPQHPLGLTSSRAAKGDGWGWIQPISRLQAVVGGGSRRPQLPQFPCPVGVSHVPLTGCPPLQ